MDPASNVSVVATLIVAASRVAVGGVKSEEVRCGVAVQELECLPSSLHSLVVALGRVYHADLKEREVVVGLGDRVPVREVAFAAIAGYGWMVLDSLEWRGVGKGRNWKGEELGREGVGKESLFTLLR